jgi:hypothetical protein
MHHQSDLLFSWSTTDHVLHLENSFTKHNTCSSGSVVWWPLTQLKGTCQRRRRCLHNSHQARQTPQLLPRAGPVDQKLTVTDTSGPAAPNRVPRRRPGPFLRAAPASFPFPFLWRRRTRWCRCDLHFSSWCGRPSIFPSDLSNPRAALYRVRCSGSGFSIRLASDSSAGPGASAFLGSWPFRLSPLSASYLLQRVLCRARMVRCLLLIHSPEIRVGCVLTGRNLNGLASSARMQCFVS